MKNIDKICRVQYNYLMKTKTKNKYELLLLKNQLCFPMYSATNRIINNYRPLLKEINLTYTQYIVMMVVWEKKILNEKDLVKALFLKSNTITPLIKKLEKKGLLTITQDLKDRRNIIIKITKKGEMLKEKAVEVPIKYGESFPLSVNEVTALKKMLNKVVNWKISSKKSDTRITPLSNKGK